MARSKATTAMRGVATEFEKQVDQEIAVAAQHEIAAEKVRSVPVVEEEVDEPKMRVCSVCGRPDCPIATYPWNSDGAHWIFV